MTAAVRPEDGGYLLGLDVGGTRIKAVALTPGGEELSRCSAPSGRDDWMARVLEVVADFRLRLGPPARIGVAAPGLPAADGRGIAIMPERLPGLEGLDWTAFLGEIRPVPVLNDAHAALLGETWIGAARGMADVILLTLGTGVGGAILSEGRLMRGHIGRAGHFGHLTLDSKGPPDIIRTPGSLEDAVGNHRLPVRSGGRYHCTEELVAAVARGEGSAGALWADMVRDLAVAIGSLINILDPEAVLIGGGIARAGDMLFQPLAAEIDGVEWRPGGHRVKIIPTKLGDRAGAAGAAFHAFQLETENQP